MSDKCTIITDDGSCYEKREDRIYIRKGFWGIKSFVGKADSCKNAMELVKTHSGNGIKEIREK